MGDMGEENEQKFGEEGDQAKQWSLCFEKSVIRRQDLVDPVPRTSFMKDALDMATKLQGKSKSY